MMEMPFRTISSQQRSRSRRRRRTSRTDLSAFIAFGALFMLYGLLEELPTDNSFTEQQQYISANDHVHRKQLDEMAVWVQEAAAAADLMDDQIHRHRLLAILKTKWPECLAEKLTAEECKSRIENDIQHTDLFTGDTDKASQAVILHTRTIFDDNYNYVVIRTSSTGGRTAGVWNDGYVYYDFPWNSTGTEAEEGIQREIPPWNGNPNPQAATVDEYIASEGRKLIEGAVNETAVIAGGTYLLNYTDSSSAALDLETFLSSPKTIGQAGTRNLGPWNCKGLTGVSCCAKIKHSVRDKDVHGKAIQCWIEPFTSGLLTKARCEDDLTKVCIYETHDGYVWKDPILSFDHVLDEAIAGGREITKSEGLHQ